MAVKEWEPPPNTTTRDLDKLTLDLAKATGLAIGWDHDPYNQGYAAYRASEVNANGQPASGGISYLAGRFLSANRTTKRALADRIRFTLDVLEAMNDR